MQLYRKNTLTVSDYVIELIKLCLVCESSYYDEASKPMSSHISSVNYLQQLVCHKGH